MSAFVVQFRRDFGEEVANATLARNILAGVAGKLSGGGDAPDDLHRRCVVFDCAPSRVRVDAVCAALATSGGGGAIEAVALCGFFVAAVVVFRTEAGAESALRGPARRSCHAVPPLDVGIEIPGFPSPTDLKMMPEPADSSTPEPCTPLPPPPEEEEKEPLPWFQFRDPSLEAYGDILPQGTRRFAPSCESLVHGPTRGADGSLWMYGGIRITTNEHGRETEEQRTSIRVTPTDAPPKGKRRPGIPDTAVWFKPLRSL